MVAVLISTLDLKKPFFTSKRHDRHILLVFVQSLYQEAATVYQFYATWSYRPPQTHFSDRIILQVSEVCPQLRRSVLVPELYSLLTLG